MLSSNGRSKRNASNNTGVPNCYPHLRVGRVGGIGRRPLNPPRCLSHKRRRGVSDGPDKPIFSYAENGFSALLRRGSEAPFRNCSFSLGETPIPEQNAHGATRPHPGRPVPSTPGPRSKKPCKKTWFGHTRGHKVPYCRRVLHAKCKKHCILQCKLACLSCFFSNVVFQIAAKPPKRAFRLDETAILMITAVCAWRCMMFCVDMINIS